MLLRLDDACFQSFWFLILFHLCCCGVVVPLHSSCCQSLIMSDFLPLNTFALNPKKPSPSIHIPSTLIVGVIETSLSTEAPFRLDRLLVVRDDDTANFCSHVGQPFQTEFEPGFQPASRIARLRDQIRMETRRLGAVALARAWLLSSCCALSVSPFHVYPSADQQFGLTVPLSEQ